MAKKKKRKQMVRTIISGNVAFPLEQDSNERDKKKEVFRRPPDCPTQVAMLPLPCRNKLTWRK
jgi:hypothetical protein